MGAGVEHSLLLECRLARVLLRLSAKFHRVARRSIES
jgi:hypothetical protein